MKNIKSGTNLTPCTAKPIPEKLFYSENVLINKVESNFEQDDEVVFTFPNYILQSKTEGCYPEFLADTSEIESEFKLESAQKWITYPGKVEVKFPLQTIQPKVQMIRVVQLKQLPRDVEVDRRRRFFAKVKIAELLSESKVPVWQLIPVEHYAQLCTKYNVRKTGFKQICFLSLEMFDNQDYDCYSAEGWLSLGFIENIRHPLPAWAYLPNYMPELGETTDKNFEKIREHFYSWQMVAVKDHNPRTDFWSVTSLAKDENFEIPRIRLMFIAESPYEFLIRVQHALKQREKAENTIKFQVILDCILANSKETFSPKLLKNIKTIAMKNLKIQISDQFMSDIINEISYSYQRINASYEFENFLHYHPDQFPDIHGIHEDSIIPIVIKLPDEAVQKKRAKCFKHILRKLRLDTMYYVSNAFSAMFKVHELCSYIETMSLFATSFAKTVTLADFLSSQEYTGMVAVKYLKGFWVENMAAQVVVHLRGVGKGWLDLTINSWSVYLVAKMFRVLFQIRLRMQESLQVLMEKSIVNYSKLLNDPCIGFWNINEDYEWTSNFIVTEFPTKQYPTFFLLLSLTTNGPMYSTNPYEFCPAIQKTFYNTLMSTCGIPLIDRDVMINLRFARNLFLYSVELIEDLYVEHRDILELSYTKCVYPLFRYAEKYNRFMELWLLNIQEFITAYAKEKKTSQEVKEEILLHKRYKEELRAILPENIIIGPFFINVEPLKAFLISKRIEIIRRLFEYYVERMREITDDLLDTFNEIMGKLTEKSTSIEHVYEIKDYIQEVPEILETLKERVQVMMLEYDVLDYFFYNLSDAQFASKWNAFAWPYKIFQRLSTIKEEHKLDIEEFKRIHINEVAEFEEKLEALNEEVNAYSLQFNFNKATEIAVDVKKTWKQITEMQKLGDLLKSRQILFELEPLSTEFLDSIISSFAPYRTLWSACSDFLKLEEITTGNPLTSIDVEEVKISLEELENLLLSSKKSFEEKPEIINIAEVFLEKIEEFQPTVDVIDCLKNPHWLILHWQELSQKAGIELRFSQSLNFAYCIKKGILDHVELVKEIAFRAVEEADAIQRAIEEEERLKREASLIRLAKKSQRKARQDIL